MKGVSFGCKMNKLNFKQKNTSKGLQMMRDANCEDAYWWHFVNLNGCMSYSKGADQASHSKAL